MNLPADVLTAGTHRKETLQRLIETVVEPILESATPRAQTLSALLLCLQHFGQMQLEFFLKGFSSGGSLGSHPLYSAEFAFDVTQNQIGYDLDVILRAYYHRTHPISDANQAVTSMQGRLIEADLVAHQALQPAYAHGLIDRPATAVTYYQKSTSMRVIPYAPVALIGIPFSAAGEPRDYASIAHEVGHYVFWSYPKPLVTESVVRQRPVMGNHLQISRRALAAEPATRTALDLIDPWLEEIFADIYGCLVAGPLAGVSMLGLMRCLPATRWLEDDGEHPIPALRPHIYQATLRKMAESTQGAAHTRVCAAVEKIRQGQEDWLGVLPAWQTVRLRGGHLISLDRLRSVIDTVVEKLLSPPIQLAELLPQGEQVGLLWNEAPFNQEGLGATSQSLPATGGSTPADLYMSHVNGQRHVGLEGEQNTWSVGFSGPDLKDWEQARAAYEDVNSSLKDTGWDPWWLGVLSAGAWTIKEPGAGNPQPVD
jgi:hypothetical protein